MKLNNKYYILRHGEAISNVREIVSSWPEKFENHLTGEGNNSVRRSVQELKTKNINFIFASDLARAKETSEISGNILGIKPEYDKRLREIGFGTFNGGLASDFEKYFKNDLERMDKGAPKGESYKDVFKRVADFFDEINNKYKDKNILIISHQAPLFILEGHIRGFSILETIENIPKEKLLDKAEFRKIV